VGCAGAWVAAAVGCVAAADGSAVAFGGAVGCDVLVAFGASVALALVGAFGVAVACAVLSASAGALLSPPPPLAMAMSTMSAATPIAGPFTFQCSAQNHRPNRAELRPSERIVLSNTP
jgi:hypothetical protein